MKIFAIFLLQSLFRWKSSIGKKFECFEQKMLIARIRINFKCKNTKKIHSKTGYNKFPIKRQWFSIENWKNGFYPKKINFAETKIFSPKKEFPHFWRGLRSDAQVTESSYEKMRPWRNGKFPILSGWGESSIPTGFKNCLLALVKFVQIKFGGGRNRTSAPFGLLSQLPLLNDRSIQYCERN